MLTVYYNSACPVCKAGIEDQRTRMTRRDVRGNVEWVDIACNADVLAPLGLEVEAVRHSLHVVEDGRMRARLHVGADAFLALARASAGAAVAVAAVREQAHSAPDALRLRPLRRPALLVEPAQGSVVAGGGRGGGRAAI